MKTKKLFFQWILGLTVLIGTAAKANNVQIAGTSVSGSNITFNISWENSWYASAAPANWDAVWVFVKYQDCNTKLWNHVNLNASGHTAGSPLQIETVTDSKGVFIRRSAVGGGNIAATAVTLSMNLPAGTYNFKVYGIEMVNIPQGDFQVGDGAGSYTYNNVTINSSAQTTGLTAATLSASYTNPVPATFPMGYNSFYCMKYEVSVEQYADFLNSLTFDQQKNRVVTDPISPAGSYAMYSGASLQYRCGLSIVTPGSNGAIPAVFGSDATPGTPNSPNDGQDVAMNTIGWFDLAAYLDWAALRPMTELEFEKVCRGPQPRVSGEYAWGSTQVTAVYSNALNNAFQSNEVPSIAVNNGMCAYGLNSASSAYGPIRVGAMATGTSGRLSSGAGYYGVMDMSGNVWETVIGTYYLSGTTFTGTLGDGTLDATGFANQATWPTANSSSSGVGYRGGSYYNVAPYICTSDRYSIINSSVNRSYGLGGRGVR
ncbi:SUMF1/EgtB/PvdO family nonheme iron enzyme [Flavobacterium sp. CYK-55]|uniref:formylglycine-generating enzyme family protein n=1 Tax=Flavobacterium sp. CYK-55 TaxID=2835529 RepID=UPI001BD0D96A|nr:SUMF1/EgtB/PvdO family nonheme iron enzyme [Flavobacterium sp. CYK-55]MBS7785729.1 SUMF1/EgtB/PvdO family nonheme iron enzyme [Flavobacterium sp. CYK-55]